MRMPTIGITPIWDDQKESYWMLPAYMECIERAGALPVMLPLTGAHALISQIAQTYDGFLFTGGHDVDPALYGEAGQAHLCGKLCSRRDAMEALLFQEILHYSKPCLGVCRGLQLINSLAGGKLYQDVPSQLRSGTAVEHEQEKPYHMPGHKVSILPGTPLSALLAEKEWQVNSLHHQGIRQVPADMSAMAIAEDGLVEAIYMPDHPFLWGVQWHPEFMPADKCTRLLFQTFIQAAKSSTRSCDAKVSQSRARY